MQNNALPEIAQAIEYGSELLAAVSDSAKLDSQVLLAHCLAKNTSYLLTWPDKTVELPTWQMYQALLARRVQGEPIAYIVGTKEFWSLTFNVSPATLIPRPDTEVLVEQVLEDIPQTNCRLLDLGTGTGAIALALASERPEWAIDAIDFSDDAVKLAQLNAKQLNLTQVNIYQSSWFEKVPKASRFDVIVSNPPYIDANDPHLEQGDVRYEPMSALVAENKGLADIYTIVDHARQFLADNGAVYLEHGFEQAIDVQAIFKSLGYSGIQTIKDYNNNDRVTFARYRN